MWVPQLPESLWWDHNAYYHRWVRRQMPIAPRLVLDVGCGSGRWACAVAGQAVHVDAVDRSDAMIRQARERGAAISNITWLEGDVLDGSVPLWPSGYDVITAISSLHHMPLGPALDRLVGLLRPGGVLAVVGHYAPTLKDDLALELVSLPANAAMGLGRRLRGQAGKPDDEGMPVMPPSDTMEDIRLAVRERLPGAQLRRGLFWRYLMTWQRPLGWTHPLWWR